MNAKKVYDSFYCLGQLLHMMLGESCRLIWDLLIDKLEQRKLTILMWKWHSTILKTYRTKKIIVNIKGVLECPGENLWVDNLSQIEVANCRLSCNEELQQPLILSRSHEKSALSLTKELSEDQLTDFIIEKSKKKQAGQR